MAIAKAKRSVHEKQLALSSLSRHAVDQQSAKPKHKKQKTQNRSSAAHFTIPRTRTIYFPQAKGRVVKQVEFFTDPSSNTLSLRFQDDTSLSFEFATGFAMEAHFSRWKVGNERVLKYWPRTRCEPSF